MSQRFVGSHCTWVSCDIATNDMRKFRGVDEWVRLVLTIVFQCRHRCIHISAICITSTRPSTEPGPSCSSTSLSVAVRELADQRKYLFRIKGLWCYTGAPREFSARPKSIFGSAFLLDDNRAWAPDLSRFKALRYRNKVGSYRNNVGYMESCTVDSTHPE